MLEPGVQERDARSGAQRPPRLIVAHEEVLENSVDERLAIVIEPKRRLLHTDFEHVALVEVKAGANRQIFSEERAPDRKSQIRERLGDDDATVGAREQHPIQGDQRTDVLPISFECHNAFLGSEDVNCEKRRNPGESRQYRGKRRAGVHGFFGRSLLA